MHELPEDLNMDFSQDTILSKLVMFLTSPSINSFDDHYDLSSINLLANNYLGQVSGACLGLSAWWLYAKYLDTQQIRYVNNSPIPRDDTEFFYKVLMLLNKWDGQSALLQEEINDIKHFLSLMHSFQNMRDFLPDVHGQGNLDLMIEDTQNRHLTKIFSYGSLLTLNQLKDILNHQLKPSQTSLNIMVSNNHYLAYFFNGETIAFYDANCKTGEKKNVSPDELAQEIFNAYNFNSEKPSPIGIRSFSFDELDQKSSSECLFKKISPILDGEANYGEGYSSLHVATKIGCINSVSSLLENGANPNAQNDAGLTPLMFASQLGHIEIINQLIHFGGDVNQSDFKGQTPLMAAAMGGQDKALKTLLQTHADITIQANNGATPLFYAANIPYNENLEVAQTLLDAGVSINQPDNNGNTALMIAAQNGHSNLIKLLLENGADVLQRNNDGNDALMSAVRNGHFHCAKLLIDSGANVLNTTKYGHNNLHYAAYFGYLNLIRLLATKIDINSQSCHSLLEDNNGFTALHYAVQNKQIEAVNTLVKLGAEVNIKSKNGKKPADLTSDERIKALLRKNGKMSNQSQQIFFSPPPPVKSKEYLIKLRILLDILYPESTAENNSEVRKVREQAIKKITDFTTISLTKSEEDTLEYLLSKLEDSLSQEESIEYKTIKRS